jgi:hypothetical protein
VPIVSIASTSWSPKGLSKACNGIALPLEYLQTGEHICIKWSLEWKLNEIWNYCLGYKQSL